MHSRARQGLEDYAHADKTGLHGWLSKWRKDRRVRQVTGRRSVLLLRSHYESFGRNRLDDPQDMTGYLGNIQVFEACRRDKLLIYYHDLISEWPRWAGSSTSSRSRTIRGLRRRAPPQALARALRPRARPARKHGALFDFAYHSRGLPPETRQALRTTAEPTSGPSCTTSTSAASTASPDYQSASSKTKRKASPWRAMRPIEGSGKCAVQISTSVSQ